MEKNVLIINFNTPELTEAAVRSVQKHTPDCKITVFDNSDKRPFIPMDGVSVIDNTHGQEIDFDKYIGSFPDRRRSDNNYGSAKHCKTVDYCFRYFEDGFVLLDSDVLVRKDITPLFDLSVMWVGQSHTSRKHPVNIRRLYPFCCFINTRMCEDNGVRYFEPDHVWQLSCDPTGTWYDTGAWFYHASRDFPHREIRICDYIVHLGSASFRKNVSEMSRWLEENSRYYI